MPKDVGLERILTIPTIQKAGLMDCVKISTGSSNQNFKITTEQGVWVLRFNQATLGINREQESKILAMVKHLNASPEVIALDLSKPGYLITEFNPNSLWQNNDFSDSNKLKQLRVILNQVHGMPYHYPPSRLDNRIRTYLKHLKVTPPKLKKQLMENIDSLERLGFWQANNTLYHSDLNPQNIIGEEPIHIIDWEYAGQGHPLLDWLIMEYHNDTDLSDYYPDELNSAWLKPAKSLIEGMMKLWALNH